MDRQQFYDYHVKPALRAMANFGNYNTLAARRLMVVTADVESRCGYKIKQDGGPAESAYQVEPPTLATVLFEWDAYIRSKEFAILIDSFACTFDINSNMLNSPLYATAIARGYYAMDPEPLPSYNDLESMWQYYKRVWNTEEGATTKEQFVEAWNRTAHVVL